MQVKTIFHSYLEAVRATGTPFTVMDFSTLNEALNIEHGTAFPSTEVPKISYLCIGRGGHLNATAAGGESITHTQQHKINSAVLFDQIPFLAREVSDDITPAERAKYRLRKLEVFGGVSYFMYYGLKVNLVASSPDVDLLTTTSGVTTSKTYVPTNTQLQRDPVTLNNGVPVTSTGEHISVSIPFVITLTKEDITNIIEAVTIARGSAALATISEVAVVSGIDVTITNNLGGVNASYAELIAAQIMNHLETNISLSNSSDKVDFKLKLADTNPLLT